MKKMLVRGLAVAALCSPLIALASYADVTVTTDATLSVNGKTINVSGSSLSVESISVGATSFTVVLEPNSQFKVSVSGLYELSRSTTGQPVGEVPVCTGSESSLTLQASDAGQSTVVITPLADVCTDPTTSSGSSGGGGGPVGLLGTTNGSGGGGASAPAAVVPSSSGAPAVQGVFGTVTATNLAKGRTSAQVKLLQQILNSDKDTQIALSGAGSPGKETTLFGSATLAAVKKFQLKWGIAKAGDVGYGNVGPKTRAKLNSLTGH